MSEEDNRNQFEFYAKQYALFRSLPAVEIRIEVYGEDFGQTGWRSLSEQKEIAELIGKRPETHVLDIACGSGGPTIDLAERTGCRVTGIDIEPAGIVQAEQLAQERGLSDRASFTALDCNRRLPYADNTFDVVICIDAVNHLPDRYGSLSDWARVLRPGGMIIFSDAAVLTGSLARDELDVRALQGPFHIVPPGLNEAAVSVAGLALRRSEDRTAAVADIAGRLHRARARRAAALAAFEDADWFANRQRFLGMTTALAASGRLSRFFYVADKLPVNA